MTKKANLKRGSFLIETSIAVALLIGISAFLLKGTLDVMAPRNWTIHQSFSDAYLTYEEAYAKRIPFDTLIGAASPWTAAAIATPVIIGKNYNGTNVTGTINRIRTLPSPVPTAAENPTGMETYILYSALTYSIGGTTYVKTRTTVRSR